MGKANNWVSIYPKSDSEGLRNDPSTRWVFKSQTSATEILIAFANLHKDIDNLLEVLYQDHKHITDVDLYTSALTSLIAIRYGKDVSEIVKLAWMNAEANTQTPDGVFFLISEALKAASFEAAVYCDLFSNPATKNNVQELIYLYGELCPPEILYTPLAEVNQSGGVIFRDRFAANSPCSAVYLCFVLCVKEKIMIQRCKMCGEFFFPISKSDEVYCIKCRNVSYDQKIKNNEILKTYRTIYKTQNARKQRNSHITNISERFNKWKLLAREKLLQCQDGEISLEEMKAQISSDDWIRASL